MRWFSTVGLLNSRYMSGACTVTTRRPFVVEVHTRAAFRHGDRLTVELHDHVVRASVGGRHHEVDLLRVDGQQDGRDRRVRRRLLVVDGPLPHERAGELSVLDQRRAVGAEPRRRDRAGLRRRVVVRARPNRDQRLAQALVLRAQIGLGIVLERGGLAVGHAGGARRGRGHAEQLADHVLGVVVVAFAEMRVADVALAIGDVVGGPVLVAERVPDVHLVVERDRPRDVVTLDRVVDVGVDVLEVELGRVDADDDEPGGPVAVVPRPDVRERTLTVDARVRPEVVQHDLAAQLRRRDRRRVDPARRPRPPARRAIPGGATYRPYP